ncbi:tyrosine-protein phosphatase [Rhodococcus qingshengii]|uniref:tyrosine-protein phosphatase n=1 Tax=Rhodococcus qingshengii TaxID=334542 RepID=UPI0010A5E0CD|nr:tyrosine-protein phosphatase [Rhodococcus qingshengii]THJ67674.1 tyrosine-protein phosphatase [Rhodococcus qingshengii]
MTYADERAGRESMFLSGAWNFRDVAGPKHRAGAGIVTGNLYRSSTLSYLDPEGQRRLARLGIDVIVDLRRAAEIDVAGADLVPPDVTLIHSPFDTSLSVTAAHEMPLMDSDEQRYDYMLRQYRRFTTSAGAGSAIRRVVDLLIDRQGSVLVHCAAGKDRTGWLCAAVLAGAGVPRGDIFEDFLASNESTEDLRAVMRATNPHADLSEYLVGAHTGYLDAAFSEVERCYGSMYGYLDSIGVDTSSREMLRQVLYPLNT